MQQQIIEFAPSFSCYSSTSTVIAKVIREEEKSRFHQNEGLDFEFSLVVSDEEVFPVFERDLLELDREIKASDSEIDASRSSSEADESESPRSTGSRIITKCKKSRSTGSGSKRWIFRYLLRRSKSEGKQPTAAVKVDSTKQKRNSGEVSKVADRWKAESPVHEHFYVKRRAENEMGKRKSYLPYRKDLVGLLVNVNGMGKMIPF